MIGHHDPGANFHPIRFSDRISLDPKEPLFWLRYWIDAYRFVLEHAPEHTQFLGYESMLGNGAADLRQLATRPGLNDSSTATLTASATHLRATGSRAESLSDLSVELAAEADAIYSQLSARSVAQAYTNAQEDDC